MSGSSSTPEDGVPHRALITLCAMVATLMQALDSTIANVALPYMQGSLSASYDEITWVLTSYIVAAAIMTAPVGWLAARFGAADHLSGVGDRLHRAPRCCAALPTSLDRDGAVPLHPGRVRRRSGAAVAGHHAEHLSGRATRLGDGDLGHGRDARADPRPHARRLPDGVVQLALRVFRQPAVRHRLHARPVVRAAAPATAARTAASTGSGLPRSPSASPACSSMLDRGETKDWFGSTEIIIEAVACPRPASMCSSCTCSPASGPSSVQPLFQDWNLVMGFLVMFMVGMVLLATTALLAPWLQLLGNYPVEIAGLLLAPRGIGTMVAMMISGRLTNKARFADHHGDSASVLLCWQPVPAVVIGPRRSNECVADRQHDGRRAPASASSSCR